MIRRSLFALPFGLFAMGKGTTPKPAPQGKREGDTVWLKTFESPNGKTTRVGIEKQSAGAWAAFFTLYNGQRVLPMRDANCSIDSATKAAEHMIAMQMALDPYGKLKQG